ncbi:hypothetical protein ABI59_14650 [Acidobacteria bacterium Mor1]|nr:hypothetical protein ABI59_14650 [Acidobacteria bacterium Mor1]
MNSTLYTAASGLIVQSRNLEIVSNNLANLSTNGFRAQRTFSSVYQQHVGSPGNRSVALAGEWESRNPGAMLPTGNPLDIALGRDELLVIETPAGRRYTRDGALAVSQDGRLVDNRGYAVLDPQGVPIAGLGANTTIAAGGKVLRDGNEVSQLQIARFDPALHRREGDNLLTTDDRDNDVVPVEDPELQPGHLEQANTSGVEELVRMIEVRRAFESYQRLISLTMNDVNRKTVNDIAK